MGDRLTAIWSGCGHDAASRQASRSTHSPDLHDEAAFLGDRNERWRARPCRAVDDANGPAPQTRSLAADSRLRLVEKTELVADDGGVEFMLNGAPLALAVVHLDFEESASCRGRRPWRGRGPRRHC